MILAGLKVLPNGFYSFVLAFIVQGCVMHGFQEQKLQLYCYK